MPIILVFRRKIASPSYTASSRLDWATYREGRRKGGRIIQQAQCQPHTLLWENKKRVK
jgi:hypothetical protein